MAAGASEAINTFVDRLIEEKDFVGLDEETMAQVKQDLTTRVEDRINATILDNMPSEKIGEFESLLDSQAPDEEVQQFCANNIPNLNEVLASALMDFRQVYLNL